MDNEKKIALVTGASRGIGRACAIALGKKGYTVIINYNSNEDAANEVKSIMEEKIAIVASLGIILGLFDDRSVTYDKGKTCHCHEALLRGSHAEIDIVFFDVDRAHCICAGCINGKDCAVLVSQSADLTDGI